MDIDARVSAQAADVLRCWALDEDLKSRVMADPAQAALARRVAQRYTAGETILDALLLLARNSERGHRGSIECVGESVRDEAVVVRETAEFVELAGRIGKSPDSAILCFDLSHIGSMITPDLGLRNAKEIASAARDAGTSIIISAEGSDRTDLVLNLYEQLSEEFPETGITLQVRLRRTANDLARVMKRPGPIRLVKGAFLESPDVAHPRDSVPMIEAYREMAIHLVRNGHRVNIATHDAALVQLLQDDLGEELHGEHVEFEMLQGLGGTLLDSLRDEGYATREYIVYGHEWWLYVLNRIAEHPERAITALADLSTQSDLAHH